MGRIFLELLNMSITASFITAAVLIIRILFRKAPKYIMPILWGFVGIRLIFPFSFESVLSLLPSSSPVGITNDGVFPVIDTGIGTVDSVMGAVIDAPPSDALVFSPFGFAELLEILSFVWLFGIFAMLLYFAVSFLILKRKTAEKTELEKGVFSCDSIDSPFILGIIKPQIILPFALSEEDRIYVLRHEKAHIKRLDFIWKPLGFILLTVYWFNPVMWVAYYFLCRDIELSCDEKVIKSMSKDEIKGYSSALLNCSVRGKAIAACPLAFGEVGVKERIKTVLSYKKPAFWVIIVSLILVVGVAVGFLTDPPKKTETEPERISVIASGSDYEDVSIEITEAELSGIRPYIKVRWKNSGDKECMFGAPYDILMKTEDGSFESTLNNDIWITVAYMLRSHSESEKIYYLSKENIPEKGTYRFESYFSTEENGQISENYTVYIEFQTESGVEERTTKQYSMKEVIYDNGSFSVFTKAEVLPDIRISPNMVLSVKEDDIWKEMGKFDEITLSKDNFDKRIWHSGVTDQISAVNVRAENKRAWQIQVNGGNRDDSRLLYILLEQNDGTLLFGSGYYNEMGLTEPNSDYSYLRWICSLEEKTATIPSGADTSSDGIAAAVYEKITAYGGLGADMEKLFSIAENTEKMHISVKRHLPIIKLESDGDYVAFIEAVDDKLNLSDGTDEFPSFLSATRNYSESQFYEDNVLFVIYVPTSFAFFEDVIIKDGVFTVKLTDYNADKNKYPDTGYFAITAISRDAVKDCTEFDSIFSSEITF